jgi:signal transduction histidine kinase
LEPFSAAFNQIQQDAGRLEFVVGDPAGAARLFAGAGAAAASPRERCAAQLGTGRNLYKAGQVREAGALWRAMLGACDTETDADGVAYGTYAAERLITTGLDSGEAASKVVARAGVPDWRSPPEVHLIGALLDQLGYAVDDPLRAHVLVEAGEAEQVAALVSAYPALARTDLRYRSGLSNAWMAWGDEPWLVTLVSPAAFASPIVIAVSSDDLLPATDVALGANRDSGTPLGDGFVNTFVQWPPDRFVARSDVPIWFYGAGVGLIAGVTALAGYLLLRDVDRQVETAELRSQFVASVSHELKTPLTAIRMFAETLAAGRPADPEKKTAYLETIVNESGRLSRMVDNVLDFSRIERGLKSFRSEPVRLQDVLESAARAMRYPMERQGLALDMALDPIPLTVRGDADALEQTVLNLLTNAVKYSGDAREVGLRLRADGTEAVIEVRDRGIGLAPEERNRIFEKFYRVRSPELDRIAGAGLGLTLADHVVHAHGGRIEISSRPRHGSVFSVRLPLDNSGELA